MRVRDECHSGRRAADAAPRRWEDASGLWPEEIRPSRTSTLSFYGADETFRAKTIGPESLVAGGFHLVGRQGLRLRERLGDRLLTGERGRELLAHLRGDAREFQDRDELDTGIGHRIGS